MYFQTVRVVGRSSAEALALVSKVVTPPPPAARNLGVGLRRPCRGQACGGVLGAMARVAHARPATRPTSSFFPAVYVFFVFSTEIRKAGRGRTSRHHRHHRNQKHAFFFLANILVAQCIVMAFEVISETHTGASPSVRVCVGLIIKKG
jgi:hypothetical protein